MSKRTLVVAGHGPGISHAVAHRFGREGVRVALVARNRERLDAGVRELAEANIEAKAFLCDLSDAAATGRMIADVRAELGPITVLHWNPYGPGAGDLTDGSLDELRSVLELCTVSLIAAVQAALPDMREQSDSAVLVTGGGLAYYDAKIDAMAVGWHAMGLAIGKASQHKTVGLLHQRLAAENIYVGEVTVLGTVRGTAFDQAGVGTLDAPDIAERFWAIYGERREVWVTFGG